MAPCNCGGKAAATYTYVHRAPDGTTTTYASKTEAEAAAIRLGGTVRAQS